MTPDIPDYQAFVPLVDSVFTALGADDTPGIALTLVEARAFEAQGLPDGLRAPFQLLFRGPGDVVQPQGNYRLQHPALGELILFMVPAARSAAGIDYAVTIN